jgi:hypothetical protein
MRNRHPEFLGVLFVLFLVVAFVVLVVPRAFAHNVPYTAGPLYNATNIANYSPYQQCTNAGYNYLHYGVAHNFRCSYQLGGYRLYYQS